jgi:hypothetical protein
MRKLKLIEHISLDGVIQLVREVRSEVAGHPFQLNSEEPGGVFFDVASMHLNVRVFERV